MLWPGLFVMTMGENRDQRKKRVDECNCLPRIIGFERPEGNGSALSLLSMSRLSIAAFIGRPSEKGNHARRLHIPTQKDNDRS